MAAAVSHPGAVATRVRDAADEHPSFELLDDVVRLAQTTGVLAVRVPNAEHVHAIAGHVARRARALGRDVVRAAHAHVDSGFRDAALRLGADAIPHDAADIAHAIVGRATARRAVVIVPLLDASAWDEAVCDAIADNPGGALFVVVVPADVAFRGAGASWFDVPAQLDDAALARWWEAFAVEQRRARGDELGSLEGWAQALGAAEPRRAPVRLDSPDAEALLRRLGLARRAWPLAAIADLDDGDATASLAAAGLVEIADGLVAASALATPGSPDASDRTRVAAALARAFTGDPWAFVRAAELLAEAGDAAAAEQAMQRAFALAADANSRSELWRRWNVVVGALPANASTRIRGAELALSLGDVDVALEWAQAAASADPGARAAFVLGRAALARGDLVSAEAALSRARELAGDDETRLEVAVDLAEVRYASGDLEQAESLACAVKQASGVARVRLGAQNLLGKLLLARAEWDAADAHFAGDACDASLAGETIAELRARVNRAIALLSRGSYDEARPMLAQVLADAEKRGELRAVGFALSNLAVLAIDRHDYGKALALSERAIVVRRRLGDRLGFARDVTNLVELRMRLGLIDQAEQGLRFGRQALGPGAPAPRLAELALAAARAHLARGRTLEADREIRAGLRTAAQASDGDKLAECHRLAVRVALEDGSVARAETELSQAKQLSASPFANGEVALLAAMVERAAGRDVTALADAAVMKTRESGDEELAREAHVLVAEIALGAGDMPRAVQHVSAAAALRDEVCQTLGRELRESYLVRRDLLRLARLERVTLEEPEEQVDAPVSAPASRGRQGERTVSFVGRHPAVRALLASVQRVGRTDATVLIHGESGTGKELVAEGIHAASARASGPMVKVNCAALVESLLLSELFGHEKGAFTGAGARKRGRFERANGGTLFLDEIGDISPRTQVALLRVLEERSIERVGGNAPIPVDVRIVCATNRDLQEMVTSGAFREDLYYRLSGITLDVPALRERPDDLPLLCDAILERIAGERGEVKMPMAADALELLSRHRWPGNVRELENALRAASLFANGDVLHASDLIEHVDTLRKLALDRAAPSGDPLQAPAQDPASVEPAAATATAALAEEPVAGVAYREIRDAGVSLGDLEAFHRTRMHRTSAGRHRGKHHARRFRARHEASALESARQTVRAVGDRGGRFMSRSLWLFSMLLAVSTGACAVQVADGDDQGQLGEGSQSLGEQQPAIVVQSTGGKPRAVDPSKPTPDPWGGGMVDPRKPTPDPWHPDPSGTSSSGSSNDSTNGTADTQSGTAQAGH